MGKGRGRGKEGGRRWGRGKLEEEEGKAMG